MSDYNRKFRELNLKISQILKDIKIINKSIQQYNKKLNKIEEKSLKKLNDLEKSYLYVKDEFSKIVTIYNNIKKSEFSAQLHTLSRRSSREGLEGP